ncbi:MAG: beta-ketoacyl synthase, partial [Sphingobacteriales bacterium]
VDALGDKGYHVSAPKSQFGHMLGAAGAVEFIASVLMLENQTVLPCLNSEELNQNPENFQLNENWSGPNTPLASFRDLIPQQSFKKEINTVTCLNYGFGGTNSAIMISKDN